MYYLFWPDQDDMEAAGFGSVKAVPAVFDPSWRYEPIVSRYLREKAKLELPPGIGGNRYPSRKTLETYGQSLCNFLEWCAARGVEWTAVSYTDHLVDGYQGDMLSGQWSAKARALLPATVNLRRLVSCEFLQWAAARGFRPNFAVPVQQRKVKASSSRSSHAHRPVLVDTKAGSVRPDPVRLRIPRDEEIVSWRNEIRAVDGATKLLMVDVVLATGVRREEVTQWQLDTLPLNHKDWRVRGEYVTVTISHGTKGAKNPGPDGEYLGPPRDIDIPLNLARRLSDYREFVRPALARNYVRAAPGAGERRERMKAVRKRLFLSDFTGAPVSSGSLYNSWVRCKHRPYDGWSVHCGRHYYACKTLLERVGRTWNLAAPHQELRTSAQDVILLVIQPQLGHVSASTTQVYLTWIERMLVGGGIYKEYADSLERLVEADC